MSNELGLNYDLRQEKVVTFFLMQFCEIAFKADSILSLDKIIDSVLFMDCVFTRPSI